MGNSHPRRRYLHESELAWSEYPTRTTSSRFARVIRYAKRAVARRERREGRHTSFDELKHRRLGGDE